MPLGIAGDPVTTVDEINGLETDELNRICAALRDRLRARSNLSRHELMTHRDRDSLSLSKSANT